MNAGGPGYVEYGRVPEIEEMPGGGDGTRELIDGDHRDLVIESRFDGDQRRVAVLLQQRVGPLGLGGDEQQPVNAVAEAGARPLRRSTADPSP